MLLHDHASLSPARREEILAVVARHTTLERVVRWAYAQTPGLDIHDVLVQDEFTHDVILPAPPLDVVLVYDST